MASPREKRASAQDWEALDFLIIFRERGLTWKKLSAANGYAKANLWAVVRTSWPKGERIVADALGFPPEAIWPSRYAKKRRAGPGKSKKAAAQSAVSGAT